MSIAVLFADYQEIDLFIGTLQIETCSAPVGSHPTTLNEWSKQLVAASLLHVLISNHSIWAHANGSRKDRLVASDLISLKVVLLLERARWYFGVERNNSSQRWREVYMMRL